ncbi:MAG: hypothetical protein MUP04_08645 [Anaerolineae bacterium]|nr:hypothetical protein [Anaerolineae bacterium]
MENIKRIGRANLIKGVVIFLVGLAIGWLAIGWGLWPVQYYDTDPQDLRLSHKEAWILMVADSYNLNQDDEAARERLRGFEEGEVGEIISSLIARAEEDGDLPTAQRLRDLAGAVGVTLPGAVPEATPTPAPVARGPSIPRSLGIVLVLFLLVALVVVGGGVALARWRERREEAPLRPVPKEELISWEVPEEAPLGQFVTTYTLGDDGYDTTFNIETPAGEFYGACGVGFSEVMGEGAPEKVTAFEVWLFDKTDPDNVQTVTKVLMSEHAYGDEALREKMKDRGEAVLVERGRNITIEGVGLQLRAQIVDFAYGVSPDLPPNSFFERLTTELTPRMKQEA